MTSEAPKKTFHSELFGALAGVALTVGWLLPGSKPCAILGWCAAFFLILAVRLGSRPYRGAYLCGLISNCLAFYWLLFTISHFGGFDLFAGGAIFALFVVVSSVQYLLFAFLYKKLPEALDFLALRMPLAWVCAEFLSVRIFPWHMGHTQLAFTSFAQVADIAGSQGISFILFWLLDAAVLLSFANTRRLRLVVPALVFVAGLFYGSEQAAFFSSKEALSGSQDVAVIQGNISLEEKHSRESVGLSRARYIELSNQALASIDAQALPLVIWPETAVVNWIHAGAQSAFADPNMPILDKPAALLFGALTYDDPQHFYNSAIAIEENGKVSPPYHKQILMPFGEFTPFGDWFPWIKALNSTAADFTPGNKMQVFEYSKPNGQKLKVSTLICYEDVIQSLARDASLAGAELLVNISNDAWFGDTPAAKQHHLIASFRAIENRRFLVRATNTGFTAIVDPLGKTTSQIKPFESGKLLATVGLISYKSIYSRFVGNMFSWALVFLSALLLIAAKFLKNRVKY